MHDDVNTLRAQAEAAETALSHLAQDLIGVLNSARLRDQKPAHDAFRAQASLHLTRLNLACAQYNIRHRPPPGQALPLRLPLNRRQTVPEFFEDAMYRQRLWRSIEDALALALATGPVPLYSLPRPASDIDREQSHLLDLAFRTLHATIKPTMQDPEAEAHGCFSDIPMRASLFVAHLHAALRVALAQGRTAPLRFIDIGCGVGMTVLMAAEMFHQADGLEYDKGYAALARDLVGRAQFDLVHIIEGDALTFEGYDQYDVIYFYQPMRQEALLRQLEQRIVETAVPGTVLVAPYGGFSERAPALGCGNVAGQVFLAAQGEAEAEALRLEAEHIGPRSPHPAKADTPRAGYLLPLLAALRASGHGIA